MYLLMRYQDGVITEGLALAKGTTLLRVITPGMTDTLEVRLAGTTWSTFRGEVVEIEFLMSDERQSQTLPANVAACAAAGTA